MTPLEALIPGADDAPRYRELEPLMPGANGVLGYQLTDPFMRNVDAETSASRRHLCTRDPSPVYLRLA